MKNQKNKNLLEVAKDMLLYAPAKFIPPFFSVIGVYIFTNILEPSEYGQYILVISIVSLACIFFFNWIASSAFRFYEEYKSEKKINIYASTISGLYAAVSMAAIISGIIYFYFFKKNHGQYIHTALLLTLLSSLLSIFLNYLRACRKILQYNIISSFESIGKILLAVIALLIFSMKVDGIIWGFCSAYMIILTVLFFQYRKLFVFSTKKFSGRLGRSFYEYGFPLAGSGMLVWILALADRYIIQFLKGTDLVGIYSAGYQIASNIIQIPSSLLMLAAFPIIIQTYEKKKAGETENLIAGLVSVYLVLTIPLLLITIFFPEMIVKIFLGDKFINASASLPLISTGQFCLGLSTFMHKSFELKKRTSKILLYLFISSLINIGLNFLLIPGMNEYGAAAATFVSYFIYLLLLWISGNKLLPWKFPYITLFKCLLSSVVCYSILFTSTRFGLFGESRTHSIIGIVLCIIVFFGILFLIKEKSVINFIRYLSNLKRK